MLLHLFHRMKLEPIDPLGDGLREEIEAERREPEAINLEEVLDEEALHRYLSQVVDDEELSA